MSKNVSLDAGSIADRHAADRILEAACTAAVQMFRAQPPTSGVYTWPNAPESVETMLSEVVRSSDLLIGSPTS